MKWREIYITKKCLLLLLYTVNTVIICYFIYINKLKAIIKKYHYKNITNIVSNK